MEFIIVAVLALALGCGVGFVLGSIGMGGAARDGLRAQHQQLRTWAREAFEAHDRAAKLWDKALYDARAAALRVDCQGSAQLIARGSADLIAGIE